MIDVAFIISEVVGGGRKLRNSEMFTKWSDVRWSESYTTVLSAGRSRMLSVSLTSWR